MVFYIIKFERFFCLCFIAYRVDSNWLIYVGLEMSWVCNILWYSCLCYYGLLWIHDVYSQSKFCLGIVLESSSFQFVIDKSCMNRHRTIENYHLKIFTCDVPNTFVIQELLNPTGFKHQKQHFLTSMKS